MCPMSKIAKSAKSLHPSVQISNSIACGAAILAGDRHKFTSILDSK